LKKNNVKGREDNHSVEQLNAVIGAYERLSRLQTE